MLVTEAADTGTECRLSVIDVAEAATRWARAKLHAAQPFLPS